ncbi:helix-turn-helix domain-containing protein [Sphingomonas ginsenosidivorax]|uniref:Helix-turn-helix domain-containing protein n=1 Tax=Sphingomonas ginsenosidivorax TaxID=862135 RepID=A0A5C6UC29_9SPHN|nr:helix-turn-helix domain-containing protein [Sphingomonas ginsenosidivorax]TXC70259.1 helix-turn-helix domain-containing protein [Sphingomonas ginsenosidivorax]
MAATTQGSNKAKIAKRVIEVLEFFDESHPQATVMDIVRRFDRPQSSTSELLSSLVEVGLLYKDPQSRSYSPTPRAAMLGCAAQPDIVRDGRLTGLIDRLSAQTGLGVAVFGMVGLRVQVYSWREGQRPLRTANPFAISGGQKDHLTESAAGRLLLSTIPQGRRDSMLRRINAEASDERKFSFADMAAHMQQCRVDGQIAGGVGFGTPAQVACVLFPIQPMNQPLAIGFVHDVSEQVDTASLLRTLNDAVTRCCCPEPDVLADVQPLFESGARSTPVPSRMPLAMMVPRHSAAPERVHN